MTKKRLWFFALVLLVALATFPAWGATETTGKELIDIVRNRMFYENYPEDVGYLPLGRQLEKFFDNGQWDTEDDPKFTENFGTLAIFQGIGHYSNLLGITQYGGRKARITVKVGCAQKDINRYIREGSLAIVSIHENKNEIYLYSLDRGFYGDLQSQMQFDIVMEFGGLVGVKGNEITLTDFLQTIYN